MNDTVQISEKMLESYTFLACNNPKNLIHEGVGLFYKDSLPIKIRDDIAFDETLVIEIMIDKKRYFLLFCTEVPLVNLVPQNLTNSS